MIGLVLEQAGIGTIAPRWIKTSFYDEKNHREEGRRNY